MEDHSSISVLEAAQIEIAKSFVRSIKILDPLLCEKRIAQLLHSNSTDVSFISLASQFENLINSKTSADN